MRLRTYLAILAGVATVVAASFLTTLNRELLAERFAIGGEASIPMYAALLVTFLIGFLPAVTAMVGQTLRRDLSIRRERRRNRESDSLDQSFRRAIDFQADGQLTKAVAELEVVLTGRPDDFSSLFWYGLVLRRLGRTEEAIETHRRASLLYPKSVAFLYKLSEDYESAGEPKIAEEVRNRIVRDYPGRGSRVMRAWRRNALIARDWEQAIRWHDRAVGLTGKDADTDREYDTSRRSIEVKKRQAKEARIDFGLRYQRGVALLEKDRAEEARSAFLALLEEDSAFTPAGIMLGEAELLRDDEEAALDAWKSGFESTGNPIFLQRIEDYFIDEEAPLRAIETIRSLIASATSDLLLRFYLGRLYYRLEMHDRAARVLEEIRNRMDPSPTFHYLVGRIQQRRGEVQLAAESYRACIARLGIAQSRFVCRQCSTKTGDWRDRCETCGRWNSVDLDVEEERLLVSTSGVLTSPLWAGYESGDRSEFTAGSQSEQTLGRKEESNGERS